MEIVYSNGVFSKAPNDEIWIAGSNNYYKIKITVEDINSDLYNCRLVIERPDGERSNELVALDVGNYYEYTVPSWVTDVAGTVKITTRLKLKATPTTVYAQGLVTKLVEDAVHTEPVATITETNYQALLDLITLDTAMSSSSTHGVQNRIIKAYVDALNRIMNSKASGQAINYGYLGIDANLVAYYKYVDNASAEPSEQKHTLVHAGNISQYGELKFLGTFSSYNAMLMSIKNLNKDQLVRAIITENSVNYNALVLCKVNGSKLYVTTMLNNKLYYSVYVGSSWTTRDLIQRNCYNEIDVTILNGASPYSIVINDDRITAKCFVNIYARDDVSQDFLDKYVTSNYPIVNVGSASFSVSNNNSGNAIRLKYTIEEVD
jgi:hypothetical protein